jgi:FixJ family two-component response regulator
MTTRPASSLPVLIVDDQADVLVALRMLFRSADIESVEAISPAVALDAVSRVEFACAVLDSTIAPTPRPAMKDSS